VIRQRIAKCTVSSPMNGTVIRVWLRPGESFSTISPRPLLQLADLSLLRVRAEVDERDVLKVRAGQKALVFPEGKREQAVTGSVVSLYRSLGRKHVANDDPAERTDREVLEMLVGLDTRPAGWPLGLRVVVQVLKQESAASSAPAPAKTQ
jgi:HlyD family secretion protein